MNLPRNYADSSIRYKKQAPPPANGSITATEKKIQCGLGKCGRCNVGKDYVCVKGPVYSWAELKNLPEEY